MIDRSSNEATDHVVELVGLDAVAATITGLGLRATRVQRLIGDAAALGAGATNETSAADLAVTMRAAVTTGGLTPPLPASSLELARSALAAQQIPVIGGALREGVPWGSKSGWVEGYRHDVAFVGDPDGAELRVLAVMTAGLTRRTRTRGSWSGCGSCCRTSPPESGPRRERTIPSGPLGAASGAAAGRYQPR